MHWFQGPQHWLDHHKLARDRRHEPFTPRVPAFLLAHPALVGAGLAAAGVAGAWYITTRMAGWPAWMLFPSMLLSVLALIAMIIGLGLLTVRAMEPALALMDMNWDAEPLAELGLPLALQRRCEALGFWTGEELARAVNRGKFPWTLLAYDERLQVQRAVDRWQATTARRSLGRKRVFGGRRQPTSGSGPAGGGW